MEDLQSHKAVDGTRAPKKGWLPVEVTKEHLDLLTPECKKVYDTLPRTYFIKLGTPVTYHGRSKQNTPTKAMLPIGTTLVIIEKLKDEYYKAVYNGTVVIVGRNSQHEFYEKVL